MRARSRRTESTAPSGSNTSGAHGDAGRSGRDRSLLKDRETCRALALPAAAICCAWRCVCSVCVQVVEAEPVHGHGRWAQATKPPLMASHEIRNAAHAPRLLARAALSEHVHEADRPRTDIEQAAAANVPPRSPYRRKLSPNPDAGRRLKSERTPSRTQPRLGTARNIGRCRPRRDWRTRRIVGDSKAARGSPHGRSRRARPPDVVMSSKQGRRRLPSQTVRPGGRTRLRPAVQGRPAAPPAGLPETAGPEICPEMEQRARATAARRFVWCHGGRSPRPIGHRSGITRLRRPAPASTREGEPPRYTIGQAAGHDHGSRITRRSA